MGWPPPLGMKSYLLTLALSAEYLLEYFAQGQRLFDQVGCSHCHRPSLELKNPILEVRPRNPDAAETEPIRIHVARHGDHPKIEPQNVLETAFNVHLFSDLRRHHMGEELATPSSQGTIPARVFLTRPLWGLAFTAPYLHDGRATTLTDAILLHGGDAENARDAFDAFTPEQKTQLLAFLRTLRTPRKPANDIVNR